jgi:hypothetical protein
MYFRGFGPQRAEASPLVISVWLELPYFIGVTYDEEVRNQFHPRQTSPARMRFRNDVVRVETWNRWAHPLPENARLSGLGEAWLDPENAAFRFAPVYCPEAEIQEVAAVLRRDGAPYVHVVQPHTVVEVVVEMHGRLPVDSRDSMLDITVPFIHGVKEVILPHLADVIDTYRVALVPRLRYASPPISEAIVSEAVIEVKTPNGDILQQVGYGFDPRSEVKGYYYLATRTDVQARFDSLLHADDLGPEITLTDTYPLLRMRRWQEATVLAASVIEDLLRRAVFARAASESEAGDIWRRKRNRFEDLFKDVLPKLGFDRLSIVDPPLWAALMKARAYRGAAAHGLRDSAYEWDTEQLVLLHLRTFARTARWLSLQMNRRWALDIPGEDGQLIDEFS